MRKLFTRLMILVHKLICDLWGNDPHEWATSSYHAYKMFRLRPDGQSFEYRDMTDKEADDYNWQRAIK